MSKPSASVICDSIGEHSPRLTTFMTSYPKFVHAEHMRHRTGSYCVSSSRAIPVNRNLEIVRSDEQRAAPVFWGSEQKGMSPGGELNKTNELDWITSEYGISGLSSYEAAQYVWTHAAHDAADRAVKMLRIGIHKSIVNRLLDPFLPVNVLVTSCEPGLLNFFGLRLDKAADPTIRALAEAMWTAWNDSDPRKLQPGQWHLPFIDNSTADELFGPEDQLTETDSEWIEIARKISTARCARLSYMSYETQKRSTVKEDLVLYERLVGSHPIHASPAEHQATPDVATVKESVKLAKIITWRNSKLHGNLPGWIQYRKTLPGEAIAPLSEGTSKP